MAKKKQPAQPNLFGDDPPPAKKPVNPDFPPGAIEGVIELHKQAFDLEAAILLTPAVRGVLAKAIKAHGIEVVRRAVIGASFDRYVRRERACDFGFILADDPKRQNLAKFATRGGREEARFLREKATTFGDGILPDAVEWARKHTGSFYDEAVEWARAEGIYDDPPAQRPA